MEKYEIIEVINLVLTKRGKKLLGSDLTIELRSHGFRSMDFSEVALRIESMMDQELIFDAAVLRSIQTFEDVVNFLYRATR